MYSEYINALELVSIILEVFRSMIVECVWDTLSMEEDMPLNKTPPKVAFVAWIATWEAVLKRTGGKVMSNCCFLLMLVCSGKYEMAYISHHHMLSKGSFMEEDVDEKT